MGYMIKLRQKKTASVVLLGWSREPFSVRSSVWLLEDLHLLCYERADLHPGAG